MVCLFVMEIGPEALLLNIPIIMLIKRKYFPPGNFRKNVNGFLESNEESIGYRNE